MISNPTSKGSIATGWENRSKEADVLNRVAGKVALVTGAGMGLGRAAALLLAAEGASVVVTDIDAEAARQTTELIERKSGESFSLRHDVSKPDDWPPVMAAAAKKFGRLDVLVNNAGIAIARNIEDTTLEEWRRTMAVNLDGVFFGCQQGIRLMKQSGGGSIINLSSIDGIIGEAELAAYCASKGGVRTLTKAVAVHCAEKRYGIRCNSIHPGYIWTPQTENYLRDLGTLEREKARALSRHPIGFLGEPNDIAYMVLYLASDESKFVTGSEMVVDGGYLAV
jgi:NAD(P)-dependent dehydrogenase (short-subunit alcohol dehydrogenase family)